MNQDKKDFCETLTHFGNILKKAIVSHKEIMTEVALVERSLNAMKSQTSNTHVREK